MRALGSGLGAESVVLRIETWVACCVLWGSVYEGTRAEKEWWGSAGRQARAVSPAIDLCPAICERQPRLPF